jgi:hypothetical protein
MAILVAQLTGQLQRALGSRVLIEQAKGVISEHHGVTVDEAFERMRRYARDHHAGLRAVAQTVIEGRFSFGLARPGQPLGIGLFSVCTDGLPHPSGSRL